MKKLGDVLRYGQADELRRQWEVAEAADEFEPLPAGEYVAHIVAGELTTNRTNGTPSFKLTFTVLEGDYKGRNIFHDIWLTQAALPMAKRDLAKLGVTELEQLEDPLPQGIRCRLKLVLHKDDNGSTYNRVRRFGVEGFNAPESDPDPNYMESGNGY